MVAEPPLREDMVDVDGKVDVDLFDCHVLYPGASLVAQQQRVDALVRGVASTQ